MICIVPGCDRLAPISPKTRKSQHVCHEHWKKLSMDLQLEFWRRTQYGSLPLPSDLRRRMEKHLKDKATT